MMNRGLIRAVVALCTTLAAPLALAVPISSADLDSVEGLISKADLTAQCGSGNNPETEKCWADSVLGLMPPDLLSGDGKDENVPVTYDGGTGYGVFGLASMPSYYIIKNATGFALMNNSVDPGRGVFDWMDLNSQFEAIYGTDKKAPKFNLGDIKVSHVTRFNGGGGGTVPVPEPGSLALFAGGLVAFSVFGRRRSSRKN